MCNNIDMKILLTGDPRVGKSTLLNDIIIDASNKHGFVTNEVLADGKRSGFELVSANGNKGLLASVDSSSEIRVSRYGVNVSEMNDFLGKLGHVPNNALLYIDEIGQMELYSEQFKYLVDSFLSSPNPFIGTLSNVYEDEFISTLKMRNDIEIIHITPLNRDAVRQDIKSKVAEYV